MATLDPVRNFAVVTASTGYDSTATSITLATGDGAKLPPTSEGAFNLSWYNSTDYTSPHLDPSVEIIRVTTRTGDVLNPISRGQEGTSATNKNTAGKTYLLILGATKKLRDDVENHIANNLDPHGTTLTQTYLVANQTLGVGISIPNATSIVDMTSTTKGLLIPRMMTTQRDLITTPVPTSLMIYNTTTSDFQYYNGTAWVAFGGSTNLDALTDVIITTPASAQVLRYNGTNWVNAQLAHADLSGVGTNAHSVIDTHLASTSSPHGATLTQTNLALTGTFDISNANPKITLTDTDAASADLQVDLDANIVQIRAVGGAANSLISLNLARNSVGIGTVAGTMGELLNINKVASDPAVDVVPMTINNGVQYTGTTTLGFMYGMLQTINKTGAGNVNNLLGINCYSSNNTGTGTIVNCAVFNSDFSILSGTTCSVLLNYHVTNSSGQGVITNNIGFACPQMTLGNNRVGFLYGYIDVVAPALPTLPTGFWAIYADVHNSYFGANVGIGTTAFGASAAKVLAVANGTAPTTAPVDTIQIYSSDDTAGNTIPSFFCEGSGVLQTGQADSVSATRVKMRINGTVVTLLAV